MNYIATRCDADKKCLGTQSIKVPRSPIQNADVFSKRNWNLPLAFNGYFKVRLSIFSNSIDTEKWPKSRRGELVCVPALTCITLLSDYSTCYVFYV